MNEVVKAGVNEVVDRWGVTDSTIRALPRGPNFQGSPILDSLSDLDVIQKWLEGYEDSSPETKRAYYREAYRFVWWAAIERNVSISGINIDDMQKYKLFLKNPEPSDFWCKGYVKEMAPDPVTGELREFVKRPAWAVKRQAKEKGGWASVDGGFKPFIGPLSDSSVRYALRILKILFNFLNDCGYLRANPMAGTRLTRSRSEARRKKELHLAEHEGIERPMSWAEKRLSKTGRALLNHVLNQRIHKARTEEQKMLAERDRFAVYFGLYLGARRSELVDARMWDFRSTRDGGITRWYWHVKGKGRTEENDEDRVPMSIEMLKALGRYRRALGLPSSPAPEEKGYALVGRYGRGPITSARLYEILMGIFFETSSVARENDCPDEALYFSKATPHWLRHAFVVSLDDIQGITLEVKRALARHADIRTTMIYDHQDLNAMHDLLVKAKYS